MLTWIPKLVWRRPSPALLLAAIVAAACTQSPSPKTVAGAAAEPPSPAAPAAPAEPAIKVHEPPDGKWLTDEKGNQYFVEKLPKAGLRFLRVGEKRVRTVWGIEIDLADEDDEFFYYKVYRVEQPTAPPPSATPTADELAAIAATYRAETPESDRLRLLPFSDGLPTSGQWRNGFDLADMNGDGHLDIVHGPARKAVGKPAIFLGDGKGSWRLWREAKFPPVAFDYGAAAAADLNGDGHMDIALAMHLRGVQALLGDGQGNFTSWSQGLDFKVAGGGEDAAGFSSRALAVADWNGDRRPDILALGEGPRLSQARAGTPPANGVVVYLNQGDGSWVRKEAETPTRVFGDSLALGDFNGDARLDFATSSSAMSARDLVNLGRQDGGWDTVEPGPLRPRSYTLAVAAADFDRDGRTDLAVAYTNMEAGVWRSGIDVLYARPDGQWERRALASEEGRKGVHALAAGDLDGNGSIDLGGLDEDGATMIFLGDGKGFFTREKTSVPPVSGCRGYHIRLADLDGDGADELVAEFAGEPSSTPMPGVIAAKCLSGGALTAWKAGGVREARQ